MSKLKPCPYCLNGRLSLVHGCHHYVLCHDCCLHGPGSTSQVDAMNHWNALPRLGATVPATLSDPASPDPDPVLSPETNDDPSTSSRRSPSPEAEVGQ